MRALVYDAFAGPVEVRDVPAPTAPDGGVLIRVGASGLCRSDWHAWAHGDDMVTLPHVPGHEFVGVVEAVGAGVARWHVGERVTAPFVCGCGQCEWCLGGNAQVCPNQTQPGFTQWGSHAELVVIHAADANLVSVPDALDDDAAASLGCRFATAFRAVHARAHVRADEWVAVYGAGGVGLSAIMIARALGARVVAIDRNADALDLARSLGAEHTALASSGVAEEVASLTSGGAHVSVDAVGTAETSTSAIRSLRRRGRHVQVGLLAATEVPRLPLDRVIGWELDVLGSHGMAARDYDEMLALVAGGALRPQDLVAGSVGLDEAARLLPRTDSAPPTGIRVVHPME
ncbi:zinc-binding dehydrogenase [Labedella endophytica]|uniref:Alcohol dehydrogenase n=1 Tax=Labedella endophytica TaxID=1523160 RepID=A0A3S1CS40_9MICO|nr:zinc-binding dehydrogenase [Labedella endophytica]RUR01050.1 alcohol dehydrogenase [Labedella endophytica]